MGQMMNGMAATSAAANTSMVSRGVNTASPFQTAYIRLTAR